MDPKESIAKYAEVAGKLAGLSQRFLEHSAHVPEVRNEFANLARALFSTLESAEDDVDPSLWADLLKELAESWKSASKLPSQFQQRAIDDVGLYFAPAAAGPAKTGEKSVNPGQDNFLNLHTGLTRDMIQANPGLGFSCFQV